MNKEINLQKLNNISDQTNSIDKENMMKVLLDFPSHIKSAYELGDGLKIDPCTNIVFAGMGGSAIGGSLLCAYLNEIGLKIPFIVTRNYTIPNFTDQNTLFIACSYSGNTEETISCYNEAIKKNAKIIVLSSGGELKKLAQKNNNKFLQLPVGVQPRNAVAFVFFSLLRSFEQNGFVKKDYDLNNIIKRIKDKKQFTVAKKIALKCYKKIPVILGSPILEVESYRWMTQFHEDAKTLAFQHVFPELNHNELNAFYNIEGKFQVIILKTDKENSRVNKRIQLTKEIISKSVSVSLIEFTGKSLLEKKISALYLGDLVSYYLALLYKTDPTPVPVIEDFKKKMGPM